MDFTEIIKYTNNAQIKKFLLIFREYGIYIYTGLITVFILQDYYIFTKVFHLHQSLYFNYAIPEIIKEQWFIVLIFLPIAITLSCILLFKYEYDTLKILQKTISSQPSWPRLLFAILIFFSGDIPIFFLLKAFIKRFPSVLLSLSLLYILYFLSNLFALYFIEGLTKKFSRKTFLSNQLFIFLSSFIIKSFTYFFFFKFMGIFKFFVFINIFVSLMLFIPIISPTMSIPKQNNRIF